MADEEKELRNSVPRSSRISRSQLRREFVVSVPESRPKCSFSSFVMRLPTEE